MQDDGAFVGAAKVAGDPFDAEAGGSGGLPVEPSAAGDPVPEDCVFAAALGEALPAFMRVAHRRLGEEEARFGAVGVDAPGERVAGEGGEIEIGILAPERELESTLAVEVAVTRAAVAARAREDGHYLVTKADGPGERGSRGDHH